ncbi:hypothetical protein EDC04DRAFT_2870893 [Pisolithus marmoratus]|nr:hypothetical protein EDC04DRAFT_2870893 [Pisolithus marmoratus]
MSFNEVGGLDDHIHALKEMTLLPLLYPETLLAQALAATCRSNVFFMCKGTECQLHLLFEEACTCQPSTIFFDKTDGLTPGQVIIISTTNRPEAVDLALRRPGERILGIMTRRWESWEGEKGVENVKGLVRVIGRL